jgi:hypothetical protein
MTDAVGMLFCAMCAFVLVEIAHVAEEARHSNLFRLGTG